MLANKNFKQSMGINGIDDGGVIRDCRQIRELADELGVNPSVIEKLCFGWGPSAKDIRALAEVLIIIRKFHDGEICEKTLERMNIGGAERDLIREMGLTVVNHANERGSNEEMNELMKLAKRPDCEKCKGTKCGRGCTCGETDSPIEDRITGARKAGYNDSAACGACHDKHPGNMYARYRIVDLVSPLYRNRFNPRNAPSSYESYEIECVGVTLHCIDKADRSLLGILPLRLNDVYHNLISEGDAVRASVKTYNNEEKVAEYINSCRLLYDREPTIEEIAAELGYSADSVAEYLRHSGMKTVPITGAFNGRQRHSDDGADDLSWADVLTDSKGSAEDQWFDAAGVDYELVRDTIRKMKSPAAREIIMKEFKIEGYKAKVRDIKRRHNLTGEDYQAEFAQAIEELRAALKEVL